MKVLVLGAGLVSRPLVRYLLDHEISVVCASRTVTKAQKLIDGHALGEALPLDVRDRSQLEQRIRSADLSVSLLPFEFHPTVARLCIEHEKPMVTTSYISKEMQSLNGAAVDAGVTILNEIGVDPGIDHMSAMRIIDEVHSRKGRIVSFKSYCGGLPAPDANDNPLGYKFSWAPRGVLLASRNGARYLANGRRVEVAPERLFRDMHLLQVDDFGDFEAYPNRDSLEYREVYGLENIDTLFRGTLRNMGWCDTLFNFRKVGLLELDAVEAKGKTYAQFTRGVLDLGPGGDLRAAVARKMQVPVESLPVRNLEWLGMFSDRAIEAESISPLDALGALMFEKLAFAPGERDLIVLFHDFLAQFPDGHRERITSRLIELGIEGGDSAMSRTVSLPAAIAARRILDGSIKRTGVLRPVTQDIYDPVLRELASLGIACREEVEPLR